MRRVVGIDVGGTFTDLLLYETGAGGERVRLAKIPTTAANQAAGVLAAIALWSRGRSSPVPVYFIGVGEKLEDLQTFNAREFAQALLT